MASLWFACSFAGGCRGLPQHVLEFCFGTSPIQAEKSRPDRNAFGSAMLATNAFT
jgi:hypothetical protein